MKLPAICLLIILINFLASCEKNINFDLKDAEKVLVVNAEIENGKPPTVTLTKSFSYFDTINTSLLTNSFVHDADVFISNGILNHKLKEYSYQLFPGFNGYYYSIDSSVLATAFVGELNTNYSLKIISEGKEYSSSVTIPAISTQPDSIWFKIAPENPDTNKRILYLKATDPPGLGNYVRYFTKVNGGSFLPGENSVADDQVIDGTTYTIILPPGIDRNNPPERDENYFKKGDTVTLKFCNIDRSTYRFWSTWEFSYQSIGNPFAQPNTVIGNISNGALGAFSGYGAVFITAIAE